MGNYATCSVSIATTTSTPGPYDCGPNKFMCTDPITQGGVCLHNYLRCNGEIDCQGGEDEPTNCGKIFPRTFSL